MKHLLVASIQSVILQRLHNARTELDETACMLAKIAAGPEFRKLSEIHDKLGELISSMECQPTGEAHQFVLESHVGNRTRYRCSFCGHVDDVDSSD